jgi:hypothetical protein
MPVRLQIELEDGAMSLAASDHAQCILGGAIAIIAGVAAAGAVLGAFSSPIDACDFQLSMVVGPGTSVAPPADAIILFDGSSLDGFEHTDGRVVEWTLHDSVMTVKPGSGSIISRNRFNAAQIHVEFATPVPAEREGQERGNSGVYLQGRYEVQVLDSYENRTYPDGQCGAVYGQYPPLVNVCQPPGEWQTFDIIFHPPVFDAEGNKTSNGTVTVMQNGVLIQDHVELLGSTTASMLEEGPGAGPLYLQDHGSPVRYRNIWLRPL